ncbi:MAG: class I SAM-dependent methyltransferase [Alphaproteobacteria bacterium]|nr:class I SAM-dependent methyltransferase [Alphaproteobacteria bacterium]
MATREEIGHHVYVIAAGPTSPEAIAALEGRLAPARVIVLPVVTAALGDTAGPAPLILPGAGAGERFKAGLAQAIAGGAAVIALAGELDTATVGPLADLIARVGTGVSDIAFGLRAPLRATLADRMASRLVHSAPGTLSWTAVAGSAAAFRRLPFARNDDGDLFRAELALQAALADLRCVAVANPAWPAPRSAPAGAVLAAVVTARAQALHVLHDRRFEMPDPAARPPYQAKFGYKTPHTVALAQAIPGSRVLDLGAADGYVSRMLAERGCFVTAVDRARPPHEPGVPFVVHDLDRGPPDIDFAAFDLVLMLDVIEHLRDPEAFVDALAARMGAVPGRRLLLSTGNVGFIVTRLMLLAGQFNYGRRGILDLTHTRLFTRGTLERLLRQSGFRIIAREAIPAPFPAALGDGLVARMLVAVNEMLARALPRLFAYQVMVVAEPSARFAAAREPHPPDAPMRTEGSR